MLKTYELVMKIMRFFAEIDPYNFEEDCFEDALKWSAELLLAGTPEDIIEQIEDFDLDEDDSFYDQQQELLSAIRAYEVPCLWFRETGKENVA